MAGRKETFTIRNEESEMRGGKQTNTEMRLQGRKDKRKVVNNSTEAFMHECMSSSKFEMLYSQPSMPSTCPN